MLVTIRDDTWNVLNMQHIIPDLERWDYSDIPSGGHKQIKGPAHTVKWVSVNCWDIALVILGVLAHSALMWLTLYMLNFSEGT